MFDEIENIIKQTLNNFLNKKGFKYHYIRKNKIYFNKSLYPINLCNYIYESKVKINNKHASRGYVMLNAKCIKKIEEFEQEFDRWIEFYKNIQEIKKNKSEYRKQFIEKYGHLTFASQQCIKNKYSCKNCYNKETCQIIKQSINKTPIKSISKMIAILFPEDYYED